MPGRPRKPRNNGQVQDQLAFTHQCWHQGFGVQLSPCEGGADSQEETETTISQPHPRQQ